jgi:hypothetical protein
MNGRGWLVILLVVTACAAAVIFWHSRERKFKVPMAHGRTAFTFIVPANKAVVFPLFGASGERAWGTHGAGQPWDPQFIWPQPEHDVEGEVFLVNHGHRGKTATWINTAFDAETGHVQYVYVLPDEIVTRIDIHVIARDPQTTQVDVVYDQTALNRSVNASIAERTEHDQDMAKEWQQQISTALKK